MEDLKPIIAKNITQLRQNARMTQGDLARELNYSDKAISKWERGESVPDITVLKSIADLFGVPLDHLVQEDAPVPEEPVNTAFVPNKHHNHAVITTLSVLLVWFVATLVYVLMDVLFLGQGLRWLPFLYAVPTSMIVWLVFNSVWFNQRRNYLIISLLVWSCLGSVLVTLLACDIVAWKLLLLGVPGQIIIYFWSRLQYRER